MRNLEKFRALSRLSKCILTLDPPDSIDGTAIIESLVPPMGIDNQTVYEVDDGTIYLSLGRDHMSISLDAGTQIRLLIISSSLKEHAYINLSNPNSQDVLWSMIRHFYKTPWKHMERHPEEKIREKRTYKSA